MTLRYIPSILVFDRQAIRGVASDARGFVNANIIIISIIVFLTTAQVFFGINTGLTYFETSLTYWMFALTAAYLYVLTWLNALMVFSANKLIGNQAFSIKEFYSVLGHFYAVTVLALLPYSAFLGFIYYAALQIKTIQALAQTRIPPAVGTWAVAFIVLFITSTALYLGLLLVGAYIEIATGAVHLF